MKEKRLFVISFMVLASVVHPTKGDLELPFEGSAESVGAVLRVSNTNDSGDGPVWVPGMPIPDPRCGGMFEALGLVCPLLLVQRL
ncbi:MAG: hypothetical protein JSW27_00815 [Phycisphaerales bacterium]|nr:MAG: hypothetical protein JSW27_00815 [Phycisphaerales bacterium]